MRYIDRGGPRPATWSPARQLGTASVASEISMIMDATALRPSRQALAAERWSCQMAAIQSRASIVSERFSARARRSAGGETRTGAPTTPHPG